MPSQARWGKQERSSLMSALSVLFLLHRRYKSKILIVMIKR